MKKQAGCGHSPHATAPSGHPSAPEIAEEVSDYHTVEQAARRLQLSPNALRLRIRRRARRDGRRVTAHLGGGIVAVQLGRSWRVTFPI